MIAKYTGKGTQGFCTNTTSPALLLSLLSRSSIPLPPLSITNPISGTQEVEDTLASLEVRIGKAMAELCGEEDPTVFVKLSSRSPKDARNRKAVKLDILRSLLKGGGVFFFFLC
jgi:hypothetical protein